MAGACTGSSVVVVVVAGIESKEEDIVHTVPGTGCRTERRNWGRTGNCRCLDRTRSHSIGHSVASSWDRSSLSSQMDTGNHLIAETS